MVTVTGYDSLDEMFDELFWCMKIADKKVEPWQDEVKPGDYYMQETNYGITLVGKVLLYPDDPFYQTPYGKNYRFVEAFSVACRDGEKGDIHISQISSVISKEMFESAKEIIKKGDDSIEKKSEEFQCSTL